MRWSFFDKFQVWINEELVNQHQYQHWKRWEGGAMVEVIQIKKKEENPNNEADDLKQLKSCGSKL